MRRKGWLCLVCLVCFFHNVAAQQERLDSLQKVEKNYQKSDSGRVLLLIELMKECRKLKRTRERFLYAEAATALGKKIHYLSHFPRYTMSWASIMKAILNSKNQSLIMKEPLT